MFVVRMNMVLRQKHKRLKNASRRVNCATNITRFTRRHTNGLTLDSITLVAHPHLYILKFRNRFFQISGRTDSSRNKKKSKLTAKVALNSWQIDMSKGSVPIAATRMPGETNVMVVAGR